MTESTTETVTLEQLTLPGFNIGSLKTELDAGLNAAITALGFVTKWGGLFLPPSVESSLTMLVKVLSSVKAIVDKL